MCVSVCCVDTKWQCVPWKLATTKKKKREKTILSAIPKGILILSFFRVKKMQFTGWSLAQSLTNTLKSCGNWDNKIIRLDFMWSANGELETMPSGNILWCSWTEIIQQKVLFAKLKDGPPVFQDSVCLDQRSRTFFFTLGATAKQQIWFLERGWRATWSFQATIWRSLV